MLYIIPAWYNKNTWNENEQMWYMRHMHSEFDDSVKQIQLIHRSRKMPYRVLLLSYAPNLRHFLHRQGLYQAPYWSVFDAIQETENKGAAVLSYKDLAWPEGVEFVYTSFAIIVKLHDEKIAQIEFGEDGNMILVDGFVNGVISGRYVYDDRGFISSTIVYERGKPQFQDFFTPAGQAKIRHYFNDDHVEVNTTDAVYNISKNDETVKHSFKKTHYDSMEEMISEVLNTYLAQTTDMDVFCVAMHSRHSKMLNKILEGRKYILSFFENRYLAADHPECSDELKKAGFIVVDEQRHMRKIRETFDIPDERITDISPYDTRIDNGISEQLTEQNILIPIDGLPDNVFERLVMIITDYYESHQRIRAHLFTRKPDYERISQIEEQISIFLRRKGYNADTLNGEISCVAENDMDMDIDEKRSKIFTVDQCISELEVSKCLRETRLVADLREGIDLYLQVGAISMGIPMIAYNETQFVADKKNASVIGNVSDLKGALDHYLDGLNNWNKAHIECYEIGKKYTTKVLLNKWKGVFETLARD